MFEQNRGRGMIAGVVNTWEHILTSDIIVVIQYGSRDPYSFMFSISSHAFR
jgi:hypothetical protein